MRRAAPLAASASRRRRGGATAMAAALAGALAGPGGASPQGLSPEVGGCPVFPRSNVWNQPVDQLPVAKDSAAPIRSIGLGAPLRAGFGSGLYHGQEIGIPYVVVSGASTPKTTPRFQYANESDKGPYPIPANVPIEGDPHPDGDRHA